MNYRYYFNGVISIIFFMKKNVLFLLCLIIGVICSVFGFIKLNYVYANVSSEYEDNAILLVPYYWLILIIGGLILITLSYVSWRKYKGTIKRRKNREAND